MIPEKAELFRKERAESGGSSQEGEMAELPKESDGGPAVFFSGGPAIRKEVRDERF